MKDSAGEIDVSFVIVNYRQNQLLARCLESLIDNTSGVLYEVIVVDNAPDDVFLDELRQSFPRVRLIKNEENTGFGPANNKAAKVSRGRYLFFVNPDIIFKSDAAAGLTRFLDKNQLAGVAGCRLTNEDGSLQYSIRRYPTIVNQLAEALFLHRLWPVNEKTSCMVRDADRYAVEQSVQWLSGAALLARRSAFEAVGGFDEDFFLYSEEEDLCFRLTRTGWTINYYPETTLIHLGGQSGVEPKLLAQLVASKILFFTKNYPALKQPLLRFAWAVRLAIRYFGWLMIAVFSAGRRQTAKKRLIYFKKGLGVALDPRPKWRQL